MDNLIDKLPIIVVCVCVGAALLGIHTIRTRRKQRTDAVSKAADRYFNQQHR